MKKKLALLNLYEGKQNQGIRALHEIFAIFEDEIEYTEFDVRLKHEVPDLDFDIYISSGGPGDPLKGDGVWEKKWQGWVDAVWQHNQKVKHSSEKKYVFFICHSFQMACHHFGLGKITKRKSTSFGVFPCHKTEAGMQDPLLMDLPNPFQVVDSRDWQLVQPNYRKFTHLGAQILALEKLRNHVRYERAIMAIRFSPEIVGTQFHPEADPYGMKKHFENEENRRVVIENYNEERYKKMMLGLEDPTMLADTHTKLIPGFISRSLSKLNSKQLNPV